MPQSPVFDGSKKDNKGVNAFTFDNESDDNDEFHRIKSTQLHDAVTNKDVAKVEKLLENPNIQVNLENKEHYTPLHLAAENGNIAIVNALLKHKDISVNYNHFTDNYMNNRDKGEEDVQFNRAVWTTFEPDYQERDSQETARHNLYTPLHLAAMNGHVEVVKALLAHKGIKLDSEDIYGKTPLDLATNDDIKILLQDKINPPKKEAKKKKPSFLSSLFRTSKRSSSKGGRRKSRHTTKSKRKKRTKRRRKFS